MGCVLQLRMPQRQDKPGSTTAIKKPFEVRDRVRIKFRVWVIVHHDKRPVTNDFSSINNCGVCLFYNLQCHKYETWVRGQVESGRDLEAGEGE